MRTHRLIFGLIGLLLLGLPACCAGSRLDAPTWPKSFSLKAGQVAVFPVVVPALGAVSIEVSWQGAPLTIGVTDAWGQALVAPALTEASPLKLALNIEQPTLRKGKQLQLTIRASANVRSLATGQVNVTTPKAPAKVAIKASAATGPKAAIREDLIHQLITGEPELLTLSPASGKPGDILTLTAHNVVPDAAETHVNFILAANSSSEGKVLSATADKNGIVTLRVQVPNDRNAIKPYGGLVFITSTATDPALTGNAFQFQFVPMPLPANGPINSSTVNRLAPAWQTQVFTTPNCYISWSSPAVDEQHGLFVFAAHETDQDTRAMTERLVAVRIADGTIAWTITRTGAAAQKNFGPAFVMNGMVYDLEESMSNTLGAYDGALGAPRWSKSYSPGLRWLWPSNGDLLAGQDSTAAAGKLHGLDPLTGTERWSLDTGVKVSMPALDGNSLYVCTMNLGLQAFDNHAAPARWAYYPIMAMDPYTPAAGGGFVFTGGVFCSAVYAVKVADGKPAWKIYPKSRFTGASEGLSAPPLYAFGTLYVLTADSKFKGQTIRALNPTTGAALWDQSWTGNLIDQAAPSPFMPINDLLVTKEGTAYNPQTGSTLWCDSLRLEYLTPYKDRALIGFDSTGKVCCYTPQ